MRNAGNDAALDRLPGHLALAPLANGQIAVFRIFARVSACRDKRSLSRKRFLKEIEALFVQVLLLAHDMGMLKMGTVALDGTKIHANASRHSALICRSLADARRPEQKLAVASASSQRLRQRWTVLRHVPSCLAVSLTLIPSLASMMIRARSASFCGVECARIMAISSLACSAVVCTGAAMRSAMRSSIAW
jgi:hypothetical protein